MRLHYYSSDWGGGYRNLGDWLTVPILRHWGYKVDPVDPTKPVLFGIGSIIGHVPLYPPTTPIVVWGSGVMDPSDARFYTNVSYRAVRSELTRDLLELPKSTPLGYPTLALPKLLTLPKAKSVGTLYINHCGTEPIYVAPEFDTSVSSKVHEDSALELIAKIASASFVASESMHGTIIAAAYGVPWAPCSGASGCPLSFKWTEWMHYLGLPPIVHSLPATMAEARRWWETVGSRGRIRCVDEVMGAFPHDIAEL